MTQPNPAAKQFINDFLKSHGYGYCLPGQPLRPPIKKTGNIVQDYINAAGFGLSKKIEAQD
jgi:hypothetical protein